MAQHDLDIGDDAGGAVRADINSVLTALTTLNSGNTAPPTTDSFQLWADTSTNQLKQRNSGNTGWVLVGTLGSVNMGLAKLASPTLTGTPMAPTPATADSSTKIATTAMVQLAAQAKVNTHTTIHTNLNGTSTSERTIYINNGSPSSPVGGTPATADGDVWFEY